MLPLNLLCLLESKSSACFCCCMFWGIICYSVFFSLLQYLSLCLIEHYSTNWCNTLNDIKYFLSWILWSNVSRWFPWVRHVWVASRVELPLFHLVQIGEQHAGYICLYFLPKTKIPSKYESSVIWQQVKCCVWNTCHQNHQNEHPFLAPFGRMTLSKKQSQEKSFKVRACVIQL